MCRVEHCQRQQPELMYGSLQLTTLFGFRDTDGLLLYDFVQDASR